MRTHYPAAASVTHAILRIVVGLLFSCHGAQKLFGWFGGIGPQHGAVPLASMMGFAGVLELVGGILLVIGLFARPVAFLVSGEMAVAYFTAHFPEGFWPIVNHGELAALYSFIFLFFAFNGAGRWSVDAIRSSDDLVRHEPDRRHTQDRAA